MLPPAFLAEIENDYAFKGLGYWIIRNAMTDGRLFLDEDPNFFLCVNVSPSQLSDACFSDNVVDLAKQTGFRLGRFGIELNRECRMHHIDTLKAFAGSLHDKGVRVGIDDFARGNAWLKTFGEIEPDYVKFSNELVQHLGAGEKDRTILRSLSEMTAACGAQVFIKGVETQEMLDALRGLPINITQQLLSLMGSRLQIESAYGEGSVFSFTLRQKVVEWEEIGESSAAPHGERAGIALRLQVMPTLTGTVKQGKILCPRVRARQIGGSLCGKGCLKEIAPIGVWRCYALHARQRD